MLRTFYETLGFGSSLLLAFLLFMAVIFWIGGLSGILITQREQHRESALQMVFAALFFPYPIIWMVAQMFWQRRQMERKRDPRQSRVRIQGSSSP